MFNTHTSQFARELYYCWVHLASLQVATLRIVISLYIYWHCTNFDLRRTCAVLFHINAAKDRSGKLIPHERLEISRRSCWHRESGEFSAFPRRLKRFGKCVAGDAIVRRHAQVLPLGQRRRRLRHDFPGAGNLITSILSSARYFPPQFSCYLKYTLKFLAPAILLNNSIRK